MTNANPRNSGVSRRSGPSSEFTLAALMRAIQRAPHAARRNWRLKLAALGLAILLWAVVRAGEGG